MFFYDNMTYRLLSLYISPNIMVEFKLYSESIMNNQHYYLCAYYYKRITSNNNPRMYEEN